MKSILSGVPTPSLDQLRFLYQPIVPLDTGHTGWHEALVRWQLPDGTVRGPLDILPYWLGAPRQADFTRYTIDQAAARLQVDDGTTLSINLSPGQVTHPTACGALEGLLTGVRERLIVELTEQPYRDLGNLWSSLAALRERCGVVLLDDVTMEDLLHGTRLHAPVDGIKLDRSVLLHLLHPEHRVATGERVRAVAGRYGVVVAEGVEDPRHVDALDGLGVTHVQGFGIALPGPTPARAAGTHHDAQRAAPSARAAAVEGWSPGPADAA